MGIARDLRQAARGLMKDRAFSLVSVISLGIGMGAFVALLTFSRAITAPARGIDTTGLVELLVLPEGPLRAKAGQWALDTWSYPDFEALRSAELGMTVTGWARGAAAVGERAPSDEAALPTVPVMYVSANYFDTFGVSLVRGGGFQSAADDAPSGAPRIVLSDDFWKSRVAADPDIIGKPVVIDGVPHTVVGVAPAEFRGHHHFFQSPGSVVFIPLERHPRLAASPGLRRDRSTEWLHIHGRIPRDVDATWVRGQVSAVMSSLAAQYPSTNTFKAATVEPYFSHGAVGKPESRRVIATLLGLTGAVLVVVCLNISGMMLVRGIRRERELSIRAAIGATRQRLVQHLFFEALLVAGMAGSISALVIFGIPALVAWWIGAPVPQEIDFDPTSAAISAGLCLVVSVLFGLLPAVRFSRPSLVPALNDDAGGGGRRTIRVHRVAAMVQVGLAIPFLVTSGVMLDRVRTADFGFPVRGLAAARLSTPSATPREAGFTVRRVRDSLQQTRGVRSVAVADGMPIDFDARLFRARRPSGGDFVTAEVTRVDEHFLTTIDARLLRGRTISTNDRLAAAPVALISAPLAAQLFQTTEPIGQQISLTLDDTREQEFAIIGVTGDFATSQLTTERPQILLPLPDTVASAVQIIVRGAEGDEPQLKAALAAALQEAGLETSSNETFSGIVTGQELVDKSLADLIAESAAVAVAGGVVLVLAALGIVGVVAFMVATRTREIALRMALGSTRRRVFALLLGDLVRLVTPGVAAGLVIGGVLIRTLENVMGTPLTVGPTPLGAVEPLIYLAASSIAVGATILAGLPAAWRATSVPPMAAIKSGS